MAAITPSVIRSRIGQGVSMVTYYGTSASNSADTLTTTAVPEHKSRRLCYVSAVYSNTPTQAGVTTTIDSGLGAGYDTLLNTGTANARYTAYAPDGEVFLNSGDSIAVAAPAGGVGLTAAITVVFEEY